MQSKISPMFAVTDNNCVVSLVLLTHHPHAILVIESLVHSGGKALLYMEWYDLIAPRYSEGHSQIHRSTSVFFATLADKVCDGTVRYCPRNNGSPLIVQEDVTRHALFSRYNWKEKKSDSWPCSPANVALMKADIENDRHKIVPFEFKGGPYGFNCITWAWQKLSKADIHAKKDNLLNHIAVIPNYNIGKYHYKL